MQRVLNQLLHFFDSLKRGIYILLSNLLEKAAFFLIFLFIARLFPKDVFGLISASFAFANILASIFEGGLNFYFQRESAVDNPNLKTELNNGFNLRLLLFIPYVAISSLYFFITGNAFFLTSFFIAIAVFTFSVNNLFNSVLFGKNEYKTSFIFLLISRSLLVMIIICKTYFNAGIEIIALIFALSGIVHTGLLFRDLHNKQLSPHIGAVDTSVIRRILISALPMGVGMIMVWIYDRVDVILIRNYMDYSSVAIYAVAYSLFKLPQSFANFLLTPLFSEMSVLFREKGFLPIRFVKNKAITLLLFTIPSVFLLYYLSSFIITNLYSINYLDSVPILQLLALCIPGLLLNNFTGTTLNSCRKERTVSISVMWAAVVNIGLNIYLIPLLGLTGAAIASIITEYFSFLYQFICILRYRLFKDIHDNNNNVRNLAV